jgi:hypothetical protein
MPGYSLLASPTLYPGQTVRADVLSGSSNRRPVKVGLLIERYGEADTVISHAGPSRDLSPGETAHLEWQIPDLNGAPIVRVGLCVSSGKSSEGSIHLDRLSWDGPPDVTFCRPASAGSMWKRQWVSAADTFADEFPDGFRVIQNRGRGLVMTGTREWSDYSIQSTITPHLARAFGLAARVQGLERYYALLLSDRNSLKLVKRLDGETVLAELPCSWEFGTSYTLRLDVQSNQIRAWVDDSVLIRVDDLAGGISSGGIALVCAEGRIDTQAVLVLPNSPAPLF